MALSAFTQPGHIEQGCSASSLAKWCSADVVGFRVLSPEAGVGLPLSAACPRLSVSECHALVPGKHGSLYILAAPLGCGACYLHCEPPLLQTLRIYEGQLYLG